MRPPRRHQNGGEGHSVPLTDTLSAGLTSSSADTLRTCSARGEDSEDEIEKKKGPNVVLKSPR